jgi:hypothetical protein
MGSDDLNAALADWMSRVDLKKEGMIEAVDAGLLKSAISCSEKALDLAMEMIYNEPIPTNLIGTPMWKRTGLYKASIGFAMDSATPHCAIVYNSVPYAEIIEYGDSGNRQGRPIMEDSVFTNTDSILAFLNESIKGV